MARHDNPGHNKSLNKKPAQNKNKIQNRRDEK